MREKNITSFFLSIATTKQRSHRNEVFKKKMWEQKKTNFHFKQNINYVTVDLNYENVNGCEICKRERE